MPAGKANISTTDTNTIKSRGNLPIPHCEKAKANVVNCILMFLRQNEFIWDSLILTIGLAKVIEMPGKTCNNLN